MSTPHQSTRRTTVRTERVATSSPLSPTRISRVQEKDAIANLNDRLAVYIDKMRYLEDENCTLRIRVTESQDYTSREVMTIKNMYEPELAEARKMLDNLAKEKARLQVDANKFHKLYSEIQPLLKEREKEVTSLTKRVSTLDRTANERESRLRTLQTEHDQMSEELDKLRKDHASMEKQLSTTKKQLEDEMLARIDLENKLQSLQEEFTFKENLFDQQIRETRIQKVTEVTEVEEQRAQEYESKLADALQELREQHEIQTTIYRQETENLFYSKFKEMEDQSSQKIDDMKLMRDEVSLSRRSIDTLNAQLVQFKGQVNEYELRITELQSILGSERDSSRLQVEKYERGMEDMRAAMQQQLLEYQELLDVKLTLDMEIAAYRKMLESEETRLKITPSPPRSRSKLSAIRRSNKRRRVDRSEAEHAIVSIQQNAEAFGSIEIAETHVEGHFIKLRNTTDKDQAVASWLLKNEVNNMETMTYKFPSKFVIKAEQLITIWGNEAPGATSSPPNSIICKNLANWGGGDNIRSSLVDNKGEELAYRRLQAQFSEEEIEEIETEKDKCILM